MADFFAELEADFWFSGTSGEIIVKEKTNNSITLTLPTIKKDTVTILSYEVNYGTKSITSMDFSANKTTWFTFSQITWNTFDITLTWLQNNTLYYIMITPKDSDGLAWNSSKEITVMLWNWSASSTNTAANSSTWWSKNKTMHSSAANMSLANITHTQNKGLVTLSWTPVAGASNIELSIQKPGQKTFNTLESVLMSDGLYEFTVPAGGTYIVKFTPIDASGQPSWTEYKYTLKVNDFKTTTSQDKDSEKTNVDKEPNVDNIDKVKVWPTTNITIVIIASLLIYLVFGRKKRYH